MPQCALSASQNGVHGGSFMTTWRWILAILGTIVLGALGSGLWEVLVKPGLAWAGGAVLTISTLGLDSLRDQIYADVAIGSYERASLSILAMLTGFTISFIGSMAIFRYIVSTYKILNTNHRYKFVARMVLLFYFVAFTTFLYINMYRVNYTVHAQANLEQIYRTILPYISDEQGKQYTSRMATISSRDDYIQIIDEMTDIARKNNIKVKTFSIF